MPITTKCAACGQTYAIRDEMAGKHVRCRCGQAIVVPEEGSVFKLLDELPPSAVATPSPHGRPAIGRRTRAKSGSTAKSWLIPLAAASAVGIPSVLLIMWVALSTSPPNGEAPVAGDVNDPKTRSGGTPVGTEVYDPKTRSGDSTIAPSSMEAELQRIRAAGEPVSVADLEAFYSAPPLDQDATQLWVTGMAPLDKPPFKSSANGLQLVGNGPEPVPLPGQSWPQLAAAEKLLSDYRESLDAIHEAARRGGRARFPLRFAEGAQMPLPHADQLRAANRLLGLEATVAAHRGKSEAAVDSVVAMFAAVRSIEQEPVIIVQLARMALSGMARGRIEWLLSIAD